MSQYLKKHHVTSVKSPAYGKWYVKPVYSKKTIGTKELADYIQSQASVKRSDAIAVLDELGSAMKHYLELGQKIKLDNIGTFKVGVSSEGATTEENCTPALVKTSRVLFQPVVISTLKEVKVNQTTGRHYQVFNRRGAMLADVTFEIAPDNLVDNTPAGNGD